MDVSTTVKTKLNRFQQLTAPQKVYIYAFVLLVIYYFTDDWLSLSTVGFVAIIAMSMEVWPKFVRAWNNLLGRFIIIVCYAIIANFAVAFAAQKLNEIIGIDPSSLFYSIGFATLLMAPIWMLSLSALVMAFYTIVLQVWVLIRLILKLLRVEKYVNTYTPQTRLSMVVLKLFLIPSMFSTLFATLTYYDGDIDANEIERAIAVLEENEEKIPLVAVHHKDATPILAKSTTSNGITETTVTPPLGEDSQDEIVAERSASDENDDFNVSYNTLIATFVHNVELFQFSQCIKSKEERVVFIGEFDILVSAPDDDAPYGYRFSVRNCELKSY